MESMECMYETVSRYLTALSYMSGFVVSIET
jgi:hypothetical protein